MKHILFIILCTPLILTTLTAQDILLYNGESIDETNCSYSYGELDSLNAHTGMYSFKGIPDQWHSPGINMQCQDVWRKDISNYDILSFYIKATELGHSAEVSFYGWPQVSQGVDILPYINGGILDTVYQLVELPLDSLKTSDYNLESIEILYFGTSDPGTSYSIYVDDISVDDRTSNEVDSVSIISNQVLKVHVMDRYDTLQVQDASLYHLSSSTDPDFNSPQQAQEVGMHYYVHNFVRGLGTAIPIHRQELYLIFDAKMKNGHDYTLTINNIHDLSENDFDNPFLYTFTYNDLTAITGTVKANQVGYQHDGLKYAYIGNYLGGAGYLDIDSSDIPSFEIREASTDGVVFTGTPNFRGLDERLSGEKVFDCDFSSFQVSGNYYVHVPGMGRTYDFSISDEVYDDLYQTVMKALYYQRHSEVLTEPYVSSEYTRGHCPTTAEIDISHLNSPLYDASTDHPAGTTLVMPAGWFDAGDYGRYVPTATLALNYLFTAYELFPEKFKDSDLNIPEGNNGIPDILDEAKVELDWLLAMQAPDGGVYYKVTTTGFASSMPSQDLGTRWIAEKTTFSTALFAATMAQAYRQYQYILPDFADTCLVRAERAWDFLELHPDPIPTNGYTNQGNVGGGTYSDPLGDTDDRAWAAAELYKSTGEMGYHTAFETYWLQNSPDWGWNNFQHHQKKASITYCTTNDYPIDSTHYWAYVNLVELSLDSYLKVRADDNVYRCSYRSNVIPWIGWGSFAQSSTYSWEFIKGYHFLGKPEYLDYARLNFDVQLGVNPQYKTYITGVGGNSPKDPTHHPSLHDGVDEPIPGITIHGPHSHIPMSNSYYAEAQQKKNLYPAGEADMDPYPTLRRYYDIFDLVHMSEFTIDHLAMASVSFAYFGTNNISFPVELSEFKVNCKNAVSTLSWTTLSEINNKGFEIERSEDGKDWIKIGFVNGNGNTTALKQYRFYDNSANPSVNYYRLKQVDFDGSFSYSDIRIANCNTDNSDFILYPNPSKGKIHVIFQNEKKGSIQLYNNLGHLISEKNINDERELIFNLKRGVYFVKFNGGVEKVIIQ